MRQQTRQNAHFTHRANVGVGRHGWLRLTPAYSVRLVRAHVERLPGGSIVTDPFSGTATTPLAAAEYGHLGQSLDINPFLIWLGTVKTAHYRDPELDETGAVLGQTLDGARALLAEPDLWQPDLHNIARWWRESELAALRALRATLDRAALPDNGRRVLEIAFCRTLIAASNAAFNHQSMSFKEEGAAPPPFDRATAEAVLTDFGREATGVIEGARFPLPGDGRVVAGDSRRMDAAGLEPCDLLLTSPPYVNRMSYIRELRPYMYWLRFLNQSSDAGELDWQAIGGTWGTATSKLGTWAPTLESTPVDEPLTAVRALIERDGGKNGPLLGTYVVKYFHDMWEHFQAAYKQVKSGGRAVYIIGNSTFYGHVVPAEQWYAALMREAGFDRVEVTVIRKRNSNRALFEYEVSGVRP